MAGGGGGVEERRKSDITNQLQCLDSNGGLAHGLNPEVVNLNGKLVSHELPNPWTSTQTKLLRTPYIPLK